MPVLRRGFPREAASLHFTDSELAVHDPDKAGLHCVRDDGKRPPMEWLCVSGLQIRVPRAEGSRWKRSRLPELPEDVESADFG